MSNNSDRASLWQPVLDPARHRPESFFRADSPPPFSSNQKGFHLGNAWWMAQLSMLVYQQSAETRNAVLARAGIEETASYSWKGLHWSKFEVQDCPATLVCFRGTADLKHWLVNISTMMIPWDSGGLVHSGFRTAFDQISKPLRDELSRDNGTRPLFFAGHSLGGALAQLAGTRFQASGVYTFGAPRIGNPEFARLVTNLPVYRIVNQSDLVPHLPGRMEILGKFVYRHGGAGYWLNGNGRLETRFENLDQKIRGEARQPLARFLASLKRSEPPPCLANHAPRSYISQLEACLHSA